MNPEYVNGDANGSLLDLNTGFLRVGGVGDIGRNFNIERNWQELRAAPWHRLPVDAQDCSSHGLWTQLRHRRLRFHLRHAVTQNLPVLAGSEQQRHHDNSTNVFNLAVGPTAPVFPAVPSNGLLPLPDGVFARARPNRMRLARLDAYNLTVQHQLTNTVSVELAFVGNNGHGFYANNPDVNVNQPTVVGFASNG